MSRWRTITSDLVLSGADYHHTETLLDKISRLLKKYWDSRVFPSSLYCSMLVLIKKLKTYHIMLCFDVDFISMQKIFMMHTVAKSLCFANSLLLIKLLLRKEWNFFSMLTY
jgi:hypothetical protein